MNAVQPSTAPERHVIIRLVAGGTPRELRRAIKKAGLLSGFAYAPRIATSWLRNGRETMTNAEIAEKIASFIPASTIHVMDFGPIAHASGPNFSV